MSSSRNHLPLSLLRNVAVLPHCIGKNENEKKETKQKRMELIVKMSSEVGETTSLGLGRERDPTALVQQVVDASAFYGRVNVEDSGCQGTNQCRSSLLGHLTIRKSLFPS
jgi:hypothetical protein